MKKAFIILGIFLITTAVYAATTTVTVSFTVTLDRDDIKLAKVGLKKIGSPLTLTEYCTAEAKASCLSRFRSLVRVGTKKEEADPTKAAQIKAILVGGLE